MANLVLRTSRHSMPLPSPPPTSPHGGPHHDAGAGSQGLEGADDGEEAPGRAAQGQDAHQGRCEPKRPSEGPYHPTQRKDRADYPYRDGCFYDGPGRAHYLSTAPPYVMSEVVGRSGDFDAVRNWAWAGGGGDVPGGPRVAS